MMETLILIVGLGFLFQYLLVIASPQVVVVQEYNTNSVEKDYFTSYSNVYQYAYYHHYDYKLFQINTTFFEEHTHLSRSWIKLFAIKELLQSGNYSYIVYIDNTIFLQTPHQTSLIQAMKKWSPFADFYLLFDLDIRWGDPKDGTTKLNLDDLYTVDIAWDGGFQIWKNTPENLRIIDKWISLTKVVFDSRLWKSQYPYEMGAFQSHILPKLGKNRYYAIELNQGKDNQGFIRKDSGVLADVSLGGMAVRRSENESLFFPFHSEEMMFLDLLPIIEEYHRMPEQWLEMNYLLKDIDNNQFEFSVIAYFARSDVSFFFHSYGEQLIDYCNNKRVTTIECNQLIDYIKDLQKKKLIELNDYLPKQYYQNFLKKNPNFLLTRQPSLLPSSLLPSFAPRVIVTIFAGRRDRLKILMKYLRLALELNYIQEVHLWDYFHHDEDRETVLREMVNPKLGIYLKAKITDQDRWTDYYEYYDQYRLFYPNDIIIKCDDDIVFIDVLKLPYFLSRLQEEEQFDGVVFGNIINNGITAYYQQNTLNLLPKEHVGEFEYPEGGFCGSLWESGERATKLHDYFIDHWEEMIRPEKKSESSPQKERNTTDNMDAYSEPEFIPITTRFSINFFAMHVKNWYKIRDIGIDDEYLLTFAATKYNVMKNYLNTNFFVSHLSFYRQEKELDTSRLLRRYEYLYDDYVRKFMKE